MKNSIFSNRKTAPFWAFFCAAGWSLAYPLIKLGYAQLHIASDDLGSKIGFCGNISNNPCNNTKKKI